MYSIVVDSNEASGMLLEPVESLGGSLAELEVQMTTISSPWFVVPGNFLVMRAVMTWHKNPNKKIL